MADYWKSQDRKYCDFCKCWIADNKPSVEFHEKGRRHQENVKKRLKHITKTSARNQMQAEKIDASLKQMEASALEAYRKDVQNNADLTSMAINKKLKEECLVLSGSSSKTVWQELKTKEGQLYYWNTMTNETVWEPPQEGYLSLTDKKEQEYQEAKKQLDAAEKERRKEALLRLQEQKQEAKEERARLAREKMKERRVVDDFLQPVSCGPIIEPGKNDPYGGWQTIKESPQIDLQLPIQEEYFEPPVELEPEPAVKEFKEKTVESLAVLGEPTFKKRKIGTGTKRHVRQRLDDD